MKIKGESILITGNEIDDIARYPLGRKCDKYLSDIISQDIKRDSKNIDQILEWSLTDWEEARDDYMPDDDVPREFKNFHRFMQKKKHLMAREAALIMRYCGEEMAEKRATTDYAIPGEFARDIAIASVLHTAVRTEEANLIPATLIPVYHEIQRMPDVETARQAWVAMLEQVGPRHLIERAYWNELKRKGAEEAARNSLENAIHLSESFGFLLSDAVRKALFRKRPQKQKY